MRTHRGETLTITEWARRMLISTTALRRRIQCWGVQDAMDATTDSRRAGASRRQRKLNDDDVRAIRRRRASGERLALIAADFAVSQALVSNISLGKAWAHVRDDGANHG